MGFIFTSPTAPKMVRTVCEEKITKRAGEMPQQLKVLAVLPEDLDYIPSTSMTVSNHL